jgi:hypothetical protein
MNRRHGTRAACALAAAMLVTSAATPADEQALYTWVDADGTVHYSDTPDDPQARRLGLGSRRTDLARVKSELDRRAAEREARDREAGDAEADAAQSAREAAERDRRCERAQARLRTLQVARRPFRVDENGQQLYLTEDQISEERRAAQQAVSEHCY